MSASRTEDQSDTNRRRLRPLHVGWLLVVLVAGLAPASDGIATTRVPAGATQAGPALHAAGAARPAAVPGEIVVGFRAGVDRSERAAARSAADVHAERDLLARGQQVVKVDSGQTVAEAIAALETSPDVRYAEPNWIYHTTSTAPNDPRFGRLWGLDNTGQTVNGRAGTTDADIDAPEAWDVGRGSTSTMVAVLDTGVAWDHPDLAPNMWSNPGEIPGNGVDDEGNGKVDDVRGWDFVDGDDNPWDIHDHGTHVAGTIAARGDNGVGVAGVAWQASIMPVRVLGPDGGTDADIADGFTYAAANGAKVVNASLGGPGASQAISDAVTSNPGTLFVVSAGNGGADGIGDDNDATPSFPCNIPAPNLICVAATDNSDTLARFSNYGATAVDLAAPGVDIDSTRPHYADQFNDDFETGLSKWTVQSGPWGTRTVNNTTWMTDSPGTTYSGNADWAIRTSAKIDVGARGDCLLKFAYGSFLEDDADWLDVQSSTDGATWRDLGRLGDTGGAVRIEGVAVGAAGDSYYRFRLTSNASNNSDGVYIDNVRLACPGGTYGDADYRTLSGTSMAAPQVAGAAVVLFSAKPSATAAQVKAALLNTGDPLAGLSGKTVSGRRLNLNAALTALLTKADTTTTITSDAPDPSVAGQAVTVRFTVAPVAPGAGTPTGTVTVNDGADSCTGTVADGQCTLTLATAGRRTLTATYAGDSNFKASSSNGEPHTVNPPTAPAAPTAPTTPAGPAEPAASTAPTLPLAQVSDATQTPQTFRVAAKSQAVQTGRRRPPVGTTIKYKLDRAASVRFDFTQPGRGRTVNGKCVPRNGRNQRKPKCTLLRGSLTFAGHAGLNTVRFNGWLSRSRKLTPGKYTLVITAITQSLGTTSQQLRFTIVR